jgi:hypothetical protein
MLQLKSIMPLKSGRILMRGLSDKSNKAQCWRCLINMKRYFYYSHQLWVSSCSLENQVTASTTIDKADKQTTHKQCCAWSSLNNQATIVTTINEVDECITQLMLYLRFAWKSSYSSESIIIDKINKHNKFIWGSSFRIDEHTTYKSRIKLHSKWTTQCTNSKSKI